MIVGTGAVHSPAKSRGPLTAGPRPNPSATLPQARLVLAVVARPGDESYYVGAVLDAFRGAGAAISILAFTRGEASPYNASMQRLEAIRPFEFEIATFVLRSTHRMLIDYPDDALNGVPVDDLAAPVARAAREWGADLILTLDGPLYRATADAACLAGRALGVPVLAWTLPDDVASAVRGVIGTPMPMSGHPLERIDFAITVSRQGQRCAMRAHHSQSAGDDAQLVRLDIQGPHDWLRWLLHPEECTLRRAERGPS